MQLRRTDLQELHCITPLANVPSIVRLGILCHERARAVDHISAADAEVQARRARRGVPNGLRLHQYANLYIDARNVMMFVRKGEHLDLCVLRVSPDVLDLPNVVIADRNAAADLARFSPAPTGLALIDRDRVFAEWWSDSLEARQVRCAEVLVPGEVPPRFLIGAYVSCEEARRRFDALDLTEPRLQATINEHLFYR
jgi:hypothetical protein